MEDLLDLTRITRGKLALLRRPVDLHEGWASPAYFAATAQAIINFACPILSVAFSFNDYLLPGLMIQADFFFALLFQQFVSRLVLLHLAIRDSCFFGLGRRLGFLDRRSCCCSWCLLDRA
jgi:hypothetical protein